MSRTNTSLIKVALKTLELTGANRIAAPLTGGIGAILMLHHVAPETGEDFEPNRILRITPDYLEKVIRLIREMGYEPIGLDDIPSRMAAGPNAKPFVAFTFDDGYRDNRDYALPVMRRYDIPFAVYAVTDYLDGNGELWWLALEKSIRLLEKIDLVLGRQHIVLPARSTEEKYRAFHKVYWAMRAIPENEARAAVSILSEQAGFDAKQPCRDLVMDWDELRDFAADPLVTIGAHTTGHYALAKLDAATARRQMVDSIARIETELDLPCRHFSFPYGNDMACGPREFRFARQLGMMTAVTTEKGLIHAHHRGSMTALPRVSLNGDYQDLGYLRTLLSGAPFAFMKACRSIADTPAAAARALFTPRPPATST